MSDDRTKILLDEDRIPTHWYNLAADLPTAPPPALNPATGEPVQVGDLAAIFALGLIEQPCPTTQWWRPQH